MTEPKKTKASAAPSKKSRVLKRPVTIDGHKTSINLEDDFWTRITGNICGERRSGIRTRRNH
jgi:predicted DNA-binding ribbon-helix-helix protein